MRYACFFQYPDGKDVQINLTGFLNARAARQFVSELWDLLLSAQESPSGIPAKFVDQKKEEILKRQVRAIKIITWHSCNIVKNI